MYQHGRKVHQPKNYMIFLATAVVVGIVTIASWLIIHRDVSKKTGTVAGAAIVTNIEANKDATMHADEPLFSLDLPNDWKLSKKENGVNANVWIYRSTKKGGDDRKLELHIDILPTNVNFVRLQPLSPNNDQFIVGNLSDDCINFSGSAEQKSKGNAPFPAKWQGITFMCNPITISQTIGTGSTEGNNKITMTSSNGKKHTYFMLYTDHNVRMDPSIFRNMLSSFKVK